MSPVRPRVLICYPNFALYRLAVIRELSRSTSAEFEFASDPSPDPYGIELIDPDTPLGDGKRFRDLNHRLRNHTFWRGILWQSGLLRLAIRSRHDVFIFLGNQFYLALWPALLILRARRKRVLLWGHGFTNPSRSFLQRSRAFFYRLAGGYLAYGEYGRSLLVERVFRPDQVWVVYNSLDLDAQQENFASLQASGELQRLRSLDSDTIRLVFVGRVTPRKRLDLLVAATARLKQAGRKVRCTIIGNGESRDALEAQAEEAGVAGEMTFTGPIYDEQALARHIAGSDLCVIPAMAGLTIMHAMAYGVPVAISDRLEGQGPEVEAVIEGETGLLFRDGDAEDLADRIARWVDDHGGRQEVAEACRRLIAERYTPQVQARIIEAAVLGVPQREMDTESSAGGHSIAAGA